jgi:lipopolysaccharide/colanic/teichoic acid biosynthesis glycosyltransferase
VNQIIFVNVIYATDFTSLLVNVTDNYFASWRRHNDMLPLRLHCSTRPRALAFANSVNDFAPSFASQSFSRQFTLSSASQINKVKSNLKGIQHDESGLWCNQQPLEVCVRDGFIEAMALEAEVEFENCFDSVRPPAIPIDLTFSHSNRRTHAAGFDPYSFLYRIVKRLVDIGLCCLFLLILLPLLFICALAVRFSSPGPIFYREKRVGQFGRSFTIFKFRSMYTKEYMRDTLRYKECDKTQMKRRLDQKHQYDPRVTPIGKYLRKLSLDELPQLINVLRGDMSVIGPRPVVEAELERYGAYDYFYKLMVPGITGLWQVSGRNDVSYARRVLMDAEYCTNWSPSSDISILLRTIPAVLKAKGAY